MKQRLPYFTLLLVSIGAWWFADHTIIPWIDHASGYDRIEDRDLSVLLGHWVFGQLPRVILCVIVWVVATKVDLMPSLRQSLGRGVSWKVVIRSGLLASIMLLTVTLLVGVAVGGTFGFHPYFTKMAGDLVSNLYEEVVYRGLIFCAFYGAAAGATFPLEGNLKRMGLIAGTIGSSFIFAAGHDQYAMELRAVIGVFSAFFVYPWIKSRSLWAPWIAHMIVDIVGDTLIEL